MNIVREIEKISKITVNNCYVKRYPSRVNTWILLQSVGGDVHENKHVHS